MSQNLPSILLPNFFFANNFRYDDDVVQDNFRFGDDNEIVGTFKPMLCF